MEGSPAYIKWEKRDMKKILYRRPSYVEKKTDSLCLKTINCLGRRIEWEWLEDN